MHTTTTTSVEVLRVVLALHDSFAALWELFEQYRDIFADSLAGEKEEVDGMVFDLTKGMVFDDLHAHYREALEALTGFICGDLTTQGAQA